MNESLISVLYTDRNSYYWLFFVFYWDHWKHAYHVCITFDLVVGCKIWCRQSGSPRRITYTTRVMVASIMIYILYIWCNMLLDIYKMFHHNRMCRQLRGLYRSLTWQWLSSCLSFNGHRKIGVCPQLVSLSTFNQE